MHRTARDAVRRRRVLSSPSSTGPISSDMRALCVLRLKNKDISLKELGEKANPPLSKSAIRHRFSKIEKLAKELGYKD